MDLNFDNLKVVQLHDKHTEEIIGSVIIRNTEFNELCIYWDEYQQYQNLQIEESIDIYEFVEEYQDKIKILQAINVDFYQP